MKITSLLIFFILTCSLTSCSTSVVTSNPKSVSIKTTPSNLNEAQQMADTECKKYDSKLFARFNTKISINIYSYDCI